MSKLRSVSTAFWSDPFIEELTPQQKLLFLYLITNEKTNMLGIYEASIKKISFETGLKDSDILMFFKICEQKSKIKYIGNYVVLMNFARHQNYNINMKKSAIDVYNSLPKELKDSNLMIDKSNPSEGFESLLNHLGTVSKYEVEVEVEAKVEVEIEDENTIFSFDEFWETYNKKTGRVNCERIYARLKDKDYAKIKETLPIYLERLKDKDKQYQKNPQTYLNGRYWEDEIYQEEAKTIEQTKSALPYEGFNPLSIDLSKLKPLR